MQSVRAAPLPCLPAPVGRPVRVGVAAAGRVAVTTGAGVAVKADAGSEDGVQMDVAAVRAPVGGAVADAMDGHDGADARAPGLDVRSEMAVSPMANTARAAATIPTDALLERRVGGSVCTMAKWDTCDAGSRAPAGERALGCALRGASARKFAPLE